MKDSAELELSGMTCASCAARVEKTLRDTPGVTRAYVNFATERATVAFDPGRVTLDGLTRRVAGAGYGARPAAAATGAAGEADRLKEQAEDVAARTGRLRRRFTAAMVAGGIVTLLSMPLMSAPGGVHDPLHALMAPVEAFFRALLPALYAAPRGALAWLSLIFTLPVMVWAGRDIYVAAWRGFRHRAFDMNALIGLGTGAAFLQSLLATAAPGLYAAHGLAPDVYYEAVLWILAFVLLGRFLEARARSRTSEAVRQLLHLAPPTARVLRDGAELDVPVESIGVGERLRVRQGSGWRWMAA